VQSILKPRQSRLRVWSIAAGAALAFAAAGCGSSSSNSSAISGSASSPSASPTSASFPASLVTAARQEARADAGNAKVGGSLTMIDQLGGFEQQILQAAFQPFEQETGINITYTAGQNYQQILQTRVSAGDPPDVVNDNGSGNMARYASQGRLIPLSGFLNLNKLSSEYNPGVLQAMSINGKLYGLSAEYSPQMIFINAKTYTGPNPIKTWPELVSYSKELASAGKTPWCVALSASAQTGWPAAYFIEEIFAKTYGAAALTRWGDGQIPFTSPEVKNAFETFGQIFTQRHMIAGGVAGALSKPIADGPVGLYSSPQQCQLFAWGDYAAGIAESQNPSLKPITNIDFFPIPAVNPAYATNEQASGWVLYAFHNTPQVRAFAKYYASAAFQALLASSGEWVVPNRDVTNYPDAIMKKAAAQLTGAAAIGFGPYFGQTVAVKTAYLTAIINYLQNPGTLDQDLASVQNVASTAGR
jgi:alpha-glucoside transport system substrate-binding protein